MLVAQANQKNRGRNQLLIPLGTEKGRRGNIAIDIYIYILLCIFSGINNEENQAQAGNEKDCSW